MNEIINVDSDFEMSSLDFLNNVINPARVAAGEEPVKNANFIKRIEDEIEDLPVVKIFHHDKINNLQIPDQKYYDLSMDQMLLVGMRESKAVRRSVLAKLKELSQAVAPKQEVNSSQAAMNAINSITQAALDAIKAIQQAAIIQPAIEQHTEPVKAVEEQKAVAGTVLKHMKKPEGTLSQNDMHAFISNDRLLEKLMDMVGLEMDRLHDPVLTPDEKHRQPPFPVYKEKEVYSMLKAAQVLCDELPASPKGRKRGSLFGIDFTMKREIKKAKMWDGKLFDAAYALFEMYKAEEAEDKEQAE